MVGSKKKHGKTMPSLSMKKKYGDEKMKCECCKIHKAELKDFRTHPKEDKTYSFKVCKRCFQLSNKEFFNYQTVTKHGTPKKQKCKQEEEKVIKQPSWVKWEKDIENGDVEGYEEEEEEEEKIEIGTKRKGICKHTNKNVLQIYDGVSNDNPHQKGWLCLHKYEFEEEEEEEKEFIIPLKNTKYTSYRVKARNQEEAIEKFNNDEGEYEDLENMYLLEPEEWEIDKDQSIEEIKEEHKEEVKEMNEIIKPDYKRGFQILMEYFDSISDEEKPKVDKLLKEAGL